jgi:dynein heavy chain
MKQLKEAQDQLAAVNNRLNELEKNYTDAVNKKESLIQQVKKCEIQLGNAEKLIGGLGGEETRWRETCATLQSDYDCLIGDVVVAAGAICYLGAFTTEFRNSLTKRWQKALVDGEIKHAEDTNLISTLNEPVILQQWQLAGLPSDSVSTESDRTRWSDEAIKGSSRSTGGCQQ